MKRSAAFIITLLLVSLPAFPQDDDSKTFLQGGGRSDTKLDFRGNMFFHPDEKGQWNVRAYAGSDFNIKQYDSNGDGFMDDPKHFGLDAGAVFGHRTSRINSMVGLNFNMDNKKGGQMGTEDVLSVIYATDKVRGYTDNGYWHSLELVKSARAYMDMGIVSANEPLINWNIKADYSFRWNENTFGNVNLLPQIPSIYYGKNSTAGPNAICRLYDVNRHSLNFDVKYDNAVVDSHHWSLKLKNNASYYTESFCNTYSSDENLLNLLYFGGEYSFHSDNGHFGATFDMEGAWHNVSGVKFVPAATLWYSPVEHLTFQAEAGRKLRQTVSLADNLYVLNTGKKLEGDYYCRPLEDRWNADVSAIWYFGSSRQNSISVDYDFNWYVEQLYTDYDYSSGTIHFFLLSATEGAVSYENKVSAKLSLNPVAGLDIDLSASYHDVKQGSNSVRGIYTRPLVNLYQAGLKVKYSTPRHHWKFTLDASLYGPSRVWDFMKADGLYENGYTPVYPQISAGITKRIRRVELFVNGENLTNFRQDRPIVNASKPFSDTFDASVVWGPVSGIKVTGGLRVYFKMK